MLPARYDDDDDRGVRFVIIVVVNVPSNPGRGSLHFILR